MQKVRHEPARSRFVLDLDGGAEAVLRYHERPRTIDFRHTYVPPAFRGRRLAESLVAAGMAYARERGLCVIPTCPYIGTYLERHPEDRDLLG